MLCVHFPDVLVYSKKQASSAANHFYFPFFPARASVRREIRSRTFCVLSILFVSHTAMLRTFMRRRGGNERKEAFAWYHKIRTALCDGVAFVSFFAWCLRTTIHAHTQISLSVSPQRILTQICPENEISSSNGCFYVEIIDKRYSADERWAL